MKRTDRPTQETDKPGRDREHARTRWLRVTFATGLFLVVAGSVAVTPALLPAPVGVVPPMGSADHAVVPVSRTALDIRAPIVPPSAIRSARLEDLPQVVQAGPTWIRVPAIGLGAPVIPVGADATTGIMAVPSSVRNTGWYRFSPAPGSPGVTLIIGHVDSSAQGRGAFFRLRDLRLGDAIAIRSADGSLHSFRVVAVRAYPKGGLPARLFARTGPPVLALVTCGGAFNWVTRHYADNIVIYAGPGGQ
jgi:hypothetical protein